MNKKILAAAIAASIAAPMAVAADVVVYGKVKQSIDVVDNNAAGTKAGQDNVEISDRTSRLGFKGSEDLGNGMTAVFQIETGVNLSENSAPGDGTFNSGGATQDSNLRNTYVGIMGDFGMFAIGRHDAPHDMAWSAADPFVDTAFDYDASDYDQTAWTRVDGTYWYVTPNFNGLTGAVALVPGEDNGITATANDGWADAVSYMVTYKNAGLYLGAGYFDAATANADEWNVAASYTMDAFGVQGIYTNTEETATNELDTWQITGTYTMGNNVLKAGYRDMSEDNANSDADAWVIGLDHNFSKRTSAQVLYVSADADAASAANDGDTFSMQLNHSF